MSSVIEHPDGRVELGEPEALTGSKLYSADLAPVSVAQRTWSTWDYAALWISMAHCIPTYQMASGMVAKGMAWWQALLTVAIGNVIVLAPILLNSHPGTKYGIPFPVFARAAYGTAGANVPALMRAVIACGWFGINTWIGGKALQVFVASLWPGWTDALGTMMLAGKAFPITQWLAFSVFWGLNILIIFRGMELVRRLERFAAPFVLLMTAILVVWAVHKADGFGNIFAQAQGTGAFGRLFIPSLTATIGFWSTLSLNMPDFTRFGRSQREQVVGQIVALPTTMTLFAAMGIVITAATLVIFGHTISDPIDLGAEFKDSRVIVAVVMFTVVIATLAVNIAANVVSPANDFANALPKHIDFKRGGLITGVIGVMMCPWELLANADRYINGWLLGYSGSLGSIAGVLICDYWILRKTKLDLPSLYKSDGAYRYSNGWNLNAIVATASGTGVALAGFFWPALHFLYNWSWFVGFGLSGGLYWVLSRGQARGSLSF